MSYAANQNLQLCAQVSETNLPFLLTIDHSACVQQQQRKSKPKRVGDIQNCKIEVAEIKKTKTKKTNKKQTNKQKHYKMG